jgi:hypothetical protein
MNILKKIICLLVLVSISISCSDFLNQVPDDRLTLEEAFNSRNSVEEYLANIYSRMPGEASQRGPDGNTGPWTAASDEAEFVWSNVFSNSINNGTWDATAGPVNQWWSNYYKGIRSASYFMQNVDQCQECDQQLISRYKAEARALRAMYYYYLIRAFGPVPILEEGIIAPDADLSDVQKPRTPYDEAVNYVVAELDTAALNLPATPTNDNYYGRITESFAMGIQSNLLLLAASPQFNGNTDYSSLTNADGTQLISQQYDENKWERAADAAKDFLDQFVPSSYQLYRKNGPDGEYSPYLSTRDVMLDEWNEEVIYARPAASINPRQYELTPYHAGEAQENRGAASLGVTQGMVDAYFMKNGRPIDDPQSGYQENGFSQFQAPYDHKERRTFNQWVDREPRFYVGVTYNNSQWINTTPDTVVTEFWYGGNSGPQVGGNDYSPTGYAVRKNMNVGDWRNDGRSFVMMRLAEIYLNYVEALNEYEPGNPDILKYLNRIRNRAGIPEYGSGPNQIPSPANQAEMREAIHHERQIELAFENKRYFDVRRWKIAEQTEGGPMYSMDINATQEENFYNEVIFEERIFEFRHYLYPIPQSEVNINDQLIQNPGW